MTTVEIYGITFLNNRNIILTVSIKTRTAVHHTIIIITIFKLVVGKTVTYQSDR